MYVVTFYSFKGGVGRSMALVNIAVDLVQRGRRVLMVDFDLEAPGLDTFDFPNAEPPTPGLADYVNAYLATGRAPGVEDYVSKLHETNDGKGCLWLMPSGSLDGYAHQFASIDWNDVYEQHDGYLMFEDMKAQWTKALAPHYVMIDSRTGHTDVGGICTRHLPDAVVVLFFPNAQNLRGLKQIVSDIKSEAESPRSKEIDLHYVMSNVPDLDDEDQILEQLLREFKNTLELPDDPLVVHHYPSLALLNQAIFTRDRKRSRLSREYGDIATRIMERNAEDRDGAIEYILSATSDHTWPRYAQEKLIDADSHMEQIEEKHDIDGEVLFHLARWYSHNDEKSEAILAKAIEATHGMPDSYLPLAHMRRALARRRQGDIEGAKDDAMRVLKLDAPERLTRNATSLLPKKDVKTLLQGDKQILSPSVQIEIASTRFNWSLDDLRIAYNVAKRLAGDDTASENQREKATRELILACIGRRKFAEAINIIEARQMNVQEMLMVDAFNYGMARWGHDGTVSREPFARVVESHDMADRMGANHLQCMSIAHWVAGDRPKAEQAQGMQSWKCADNVDPNSAVGDTGGRRSKTSLAIPKRS